MSTASVVESDRVRDVLFGLGTLAGTLLVSAGFVLAVLAVSVSVREPVSVLSEELVSLPGASVTALWLLRVLAAATVIAGGFIDTGTVRTRVTGAVAGGTALFGAVLYLLTLTGIGGALFALGVLAGLGFLLGRGLVAAGVGDRGRLVAYAGVAGLLLAYSTATAPGVSGPYVDQTAKWGLAVAAVAATVGGVAVVRTAASVVGW